MLGTDGLIGSLLTSPIRLNCWGGPPPMARFKSLPHPFSLVLFKAQLGEPFLEI